METSGIPQVQEIRIDRRDAVLPLVRSRSSPPHSPASLSLRLLRCAHFQYGKSSMCPLGQAMTKREGTSSSWQSPHSFFPGGELNRLTCWSAVQPGHECHRGKRRTRTPSLLVSSEAGGSRNDFTPSTRAKRCSWTVGASSTFHESMPLTMNDSLSTATIEPTP